MEVMKCFNCHVDRGQTPDFRIVQEPAEGHPEFLVAEISLPHVVNISTADCATDIVQLYKFV
jgi:hypothetical protein